MSRRAEARLPGVRAMGGWGGGVGEGEGVAGGRFMDGIFGGALLCCFRGVPGRRFVGLYVW